MAEKPKALPQAMRPSGVAGRIFAWLMRRQNKPAYDWTVKQLRPVKPKSVLELGFGTGDVLFEAARRLKAKRLVGRDPSVLMVHTAQKKLGRFRRKAMLDIALGDDRRLADGPFDAIVALHSFQFWEDPETTLVRLHALLSLKGRFVLVLRRRPARHAGWLPNPLSRRADEMEAAIAAAGRAGFVLSGQKRIGQHSHGLVFTCG
ncbi:MAG: methyltransferase [Alphaproteobacteria bacterium]|nr:methyltransferase [Alphaproteobacteria bacterium]MDE2012599.1 class I SAM-dependent methyltransferase [Alphaproteobacteria bacterium]